MSTPIGIDLGTTYSVVAAVGASGEAEPLPNEAGELLTPSAVYFGPGGTVQVGQAAKDLETLEPDQVVTAIKRQMGTDHRRLYDGDEYTPEGISAFVLKALATSAATELGVPVDDLSAVITVPAYFGVAEKEATAQAAAISGLSLLELVAEPVAAAISYGVDTGSSGLVLVYDLGGGTFDTTVLEVGPKGPRPLVTDGDSLLGGLNWDERLQALLLRRLIEVAGDEDLEDDDDFVLGVAATVEDMKKTLTARESVTGTFAVKGQRVRLSVSRDDFESECADLVDVTIAVVRRALSTAREMSSTDLQEIVLVGGSSRMPMISRSLESEFDLEVKLRDPDLAVAKGAAIHAAALARRQYALPPSASPSRLSVRGQRASAVEPVPGVLPRSLGVLLWDSHDASGTRQIVDHVIPANTQLPVSGKEATFATILKNQSRVRIELFEQAGSVASPEVSNNRRVLDGELIDLPNLPAGSPIKVLLSVAVDGRISCTATEPHSGKQLVIESYVDGVVDSTGAEQQRDQVARIVLRR